MGLTASQITVSVRPLFDLAMQPPIRRSSSDDKQKPHKKEIKKKKRTKKSFFKKLSPLAIQRIHSDRCPNCGKPKAEWKRRTDYICCSTECTTEYHNDFY